MDFMYYACGNGTTEGGEKQNDEVCTLLEDGYSGFTEYFDKKVLIFRPFTLGVAKNGRDDRIGEIGKKYQIDIRA